MKRISFAAELTLRVIVLTLALLATVLVAVKATNKLPALPLGLLALGMAFALHRAVQHTNRRLARFFESVRYSDFAVRFASGKEKGESFAELSKQFNEVLDAFRQTRAEKEASLLFIHAVIQQLSAGLLVFDAEHRLLLSNPAALNLLGVYRLQTLDDLPEAHAELHSFIAGLSSRDKLLYQPSSDRQLSVQGLQISLRGRSVFLVSLQNIYSELQRTELDAWRDLTRVLRHEIMNSITPIVSTVETMQDIVHHDLRDAEAPPPIIEDLAEALDLVASRSRGLMRFVDAYRSFSAIPALHKSNVPMKELLHRILQLSAPEMKAAGIECSMTVLPTGMTLHADEDLLTMVLLNLLKNAREALQTLPAGKEKRIQLKAGVDAQNHSYISVEDNGPGIDATLMEDIFIPFFSTKDNGSGIGLSISRQIVQLHGGYIDVRSAPGQGACFVVWV
ncbi:MAG: GHKL domain-containing protein [Saprospiraceae bacterium]|nr:GHKL domain-containing protein [Saprospiraceae bacterium]